MMTEKVQKIGIKREYGFLYFIDGQGDISRVPMAKGGTTLKVKKIGLKKEKGYLYFVDKDGDVSKSVMSRGGRMKSKKSKK
ncbi:MAG: hypothetical protein LBS15_02725 [Endomicrobium sp.]|jgi:hypothetical protein|nr:hypothetical protein [Endomicrobium sp.]